MNRLLHILLCDDDPSVRTSLSRYFIAVGHRVVARSSAEECLSEELVHLFDCFVFDLRLGGMSGLDLLEKLRSQRNTTPALLITADEVDASDHARIEDCHAELISKPFDAEQLRAAVVRAVERS